MLDSLFNKADNITSNFIKAVFHKFYLVHSWIPWPVYNKNASKFILLYQDTGSKNEKSSNEFKNFEEKNSLKRWQKTKETIANEGSGQKN